VTQHFYLDALQFQLQVGFAASVKVTGDDLRTKCAPTVDAAQWQTQHAPWQLAPTQSARQWTVPEVTQ